MSTVGFDTSNYTTSVAFFDGTAGENCSQLLPVGQGQLGCGKAMRFFIIPKACRSFPAGCFPIFPRIAFRPWVSVPAPERWRAAICPASWWAIPMPKCFRMC